MGIQGSTGSRGAMGAQGVTGSMGAQGDTGSIGAQGSSGSQGFRGERGHIGDSGSTGAQGRQGRMGSQGSTGSQGIQGVQGDQGLTGSQGSQGIQGVEGDQGSTGSQGLTGKKGSQGAQGESGIEGATGVQGSSGLDGSQGSTGSQGLIGKRGMTGVQGSQGSIGRGGATGSQGHTGFYGKGTFTLVENPMNNSHKIEILDSSTIRKTSGIDGWNANVYSLEAYTHSRFSFSIDTMTPMVFAGLSIFPSKNTEPSNFEYAFYINYDRSMYIYEKNFLVHSCMGDFTTQTVFEIEYNGISVKYRIDGFIVFESSNVVIAPLHANIALSSYGHTITNIHFNELLVGLRGTDGSTGFTGDQGDLGHTGSTGVQGPRGIKGSVGATGSEGPRGRRGDIGDTGSMGETGFTGDQGGLGHTGSTGTQGEKGERGSKGHSGATGVQGERGLMGKKGDTGLDGDPGKGTFTLVQNKLNNHNRIKLVDSSTVTKITSNDGWNANMYSLEAYTYPNLSFTLGTLYPNIFAGFSCFPSKNTETSNIEYGFYVAYDRSINIYESNVLVKICTGEFSTETVFGIQYDGYDIKYYIDGFIVHKTAVSIINPLHANFVIYNSGYAIENIHFDPMIRGVRGYIGAQGSTGATGQRGRMGLMGLMGMKGETGAEGEKGETGFTGDE